MGYETSNRFSTKIVSPVVRSLLVKRSRLVERLRLGMKRKLSLMVAPAGYGKTTLLGEWLASLPKRDWPTAWITLDPGDNDPLRFWGYVVDALQTIHPDWQFEPPKIAAPPGNGISYEFLVSLTNQVAANPVHFSLILDDYHTIQLDSIHKDLASFITQMPQHMHLVIASRVKPKIPLAELRVKNHLIEIDPADMTFSVDECETFLREVMGLDLTLEEVAVLARTTEGWAAGLQMAALSIKNQPDASEWIHRFSGSQSYIFDYLTEAVFDLQEQPVQAFLLKTSILTELSAPLCDYLLDRNDSQARLAYLENTNLFTTPLSEERFWYRYHALFAEFLKIRLQREYPQSLPELHLRAVTWLKDNSFSEKAIPHAFAAGHPELAAEIIESCALPALRQLDVLKIRRWISHIPDHLLSHRPSLWIYRAMVENALGNLDEAETMLREIKGMLKESNRDEWSTNDQALLYQQIAALQAVVNLQNENYIEGISLAMQAIADLSKSDSLMFGWLNHFLGYAHEMAGDLEAAIVAFRRGAQFSSQHKIPSGILSRCEIGRIRKMQGRLREAEREYRRALDFAAETGLARELVIFTQLGLGDILIEQNNLKAVDQWAEEIEIFTQEAEIDHHGYLFAIGLNCLLANYYLIRDLGKSKIYLQKARRELKKTKPLFYISILTDLRVKIWLAEGDFKSALRWVEKRAAVLKSGGTLLPAEQIGLARIYLAQAKADVAYPLLEEAEVQARRSGMGETLIETLILKARALHIRGGEEKSIQTLIRALELAEPEGYVRIFVDESKQVSLLLSKLLVALNRRSAQQDTIPSRAYIEKLLAPYDRTPQLADYSKARKLIKPAITSSLIEPLSERELDVLALLKDGKSGGEIARLLVLSYNTVKVHIRNIYQKLGAHNRKEVLERAAEYHLLD